MKLLILNSSILGDNSTSKQLTEHYAQMFLKANPQGEVTVRDLSAQPLPELNGELMGAFGTPAGSRNEAQKALVTASDELIATIEQHDVLLVAAPLYNFSIPASLKNAQDNLARAGLTFRYTENGPEGLLGKGKKVYFARTSGGKYQGSPMDSVTPLLDTFFSFLGFEIGGHIWAEGLAMGEDVATAALNSAKAEIDKLAA